MPAKPLTPEQRQDAERLKSAFNAFQDRRRDEGKPHTQGDLEEELGLKQSAMSQYINGKIPLNADALTKFCRLMGEKPESISPTILNNAVQKSVELVNPGSVKEVDVSDFRKTPSDLPGDISEALRAADPTIRQQIESTLRLMLGVNPSKRQAG